MVMNEYAVTQAVTLFTLAGGDSGRLVREMAATGEVWGPVRKGKGYIFDRIGSADELALDYTSTRLPPRKLFFPPRGTFFSFRDGAAAEDSMDTGRRRYLVGLKPCDAYALEILDKVYGEGAPDPEYRARREHTAVIGLNCTRVGEYCFCLSMGSGPAWKGDYDLLLTNLGDEYLVEAGSPLGLELAIRAGLSPAPRVKTVEKDRLLQEAARGFRRRMPGKSRERLLRENAGHPLWEQLAGECLACGACTQVCPTCFCYRVMDRMDLSLQKGERQWEWDSCLVREYAEVAMGHNFRKERSARLRQRIYHKLLYHQEQFGVPGCVGCGRCISACPKGLDLCQAVATLAEGAGARQRGGERHAQSAAS